MGATVQRVLLALGVLRAKRVLRAIPAAPGPRASPGLRVARAHRDGGVIGGGTEWPVATVHPVEMGTLVNQAKTAPLGKMANVAATEGQVATAGRGLAAGTGHPDEMARTAVMARRSYGLHTSMFRAHTRPFVANTRGSSVRTPPSRTASHRTEAAEVG